MELLDKIQDKINDVNAFGTDVLELKLAADGTLILMRDVVPEVTTSSSEYMLEYVGNHYDGLVILAKQVVPTIHVSVGFDGLVIVGDDIEKLSTTGDDTGTFSTQPMSGDFTVTALCSMLVDEGERVMGVSEVLRGGSCNAIGYGLLLDQTLKYSILKDGTELVPLTDFVSVKDEVSAKISRIGQSLYFYIDEILVHTITEVTSADLYIQTSLIDKDAVINNLIVV